jgi:hypothetical protein
MSVRVYPGAKNPTHEISLSDGVQTWGLRLDGGPQAIQETPMTPSTIHISGSESKFGDWEPGLAQIGQNTWIGGRGLGVFSLDNTRYLDGHMAFSMVEGKLFPAPQWKLATGQRLSCSHMPGDVSWQSLLEEKRYLSTPITIGAVDLDVHQVFVWLRRVGQPSALNLELYSDDGGEPGALLSGGKDEASAALVPDLASQWYAFDLSGAGTLNAATIWYFLAAAATTPPTIGSWE